MENLKILGSVHVAGGSRKELTWQAFARVVHKTYIAEFPQSAWANPSVNFGVIPERERRVLIERVIQRCTEARTFAEGTPASLIENGVVVRLKLVRTAWIQNMQRGAQKSQGTEKQASGHSICESLTGRLADYAAEFDRGWRKVILLTVVSSG
ncbi:hypothetical protein LTR98_002100 [Exophiala xenobiotica]|nr:hypothetical protein LTR98_002100 [Exophiala xenobiotica]KAK5558845.1 hypothetical protein LTR46_003034 [Exophiala xenobiotica]